MFDSYQFKYKFNAKCPIGSYLADVLCIDIIIYILSYIADIGWKIIDRNWVVLTVSCLILSRYSRRFNRIKLVWT